jgi:glycosyltransferase 2 family protein
MTLSATDAAAKLPARSLERGVIIALKLLVTGLCFWYLLRKVDVNELSRSIFLLEFRWVAPAVMAVTLQIPLVAMRWRQILNGLAATHQLISNRTITAITAIGLFFAQVLPNVVGEGVRAWLLVRTGSDWRTAVSSVVIDRGVGAGLVIAAGFVILLLAPAPVDLGGYRNVVLVLYGSALLAGVAGLALLPVFLPLLNRLRYLRWVVQFAADARRVLLGPKSPPIFGFACLIHALTMCVIWFLARAQGLMLPVSDVALLFVVMTGVALVPATINGWGLREIAVVGLLARYGVAPEQALVLSVCFGLTLAIGSLPGAIVWLLYPAAPRQRRKRRK